MNARKKNGTLSKFVPRKFSFWKGVARKGKRKRWRKRKNKNKKKTSQKRPHLWRFL